MKIRLLALSVLLLLLASAVVIHADTLPVDPRMAVTDPPICEGPCSVGSSFLFSADGNGGGVVNLQNESDMDWSSLLIETTGILAANVNASTTLFSNTQVYNLGDLLVIYFSGVGTPIDPECGSDCGLFPGIPNGQIFNIDLNTVAGTDSGGWGAGHSFSATANVPAPVPEPATLTLLSAGISAFFIKRKVRNPRKTKN